MDRSSGRPLAIPMAMAWASRALFIRRETPLSPRHRRQAASTSPRKDSTPAKAAKNPTATASTTHSTGMAASNPRPRASSPPATPVSRPPREAYTSSKMGSTRTSSTAITSSISTNITAG